MAADHRAQAGKIWPILVEAATAKAKLSYGELGPRVSIFPRNLNPPLDVIARYCQRNRLPPLTAVVVEGEDAASVYGFEWSTVKNPFELFLSTK
jgi:hypothetical protein